MQGIKQPICYGCLPSKLDGTEQVLTIDDKIKLPDEFDLRNIMPPVRNQGATLTCVCQTLTGILDFLHNSKTGKMGVCNNYPVNTLYSMRSNRGEGMSIKEGMSILLNKGLNGARINSYALVPSIILVKYAMIMFGPVAAGLPTYMDNDPYFWRKGGGYSGGHCICLCGYNKDGFILRNSWGSNWANRGYITIPYDEYAESVFEAWTVTL